MPASAAQVFGPTTVNPGFNTTGEKTLLTMSTTLAAGGMNVIVATMALPSGFEQPGRFRLRIKRGTTILYETVADYGGGGGCNNPYTIIALDTNPVGSDTYTFTINILTTVTSSVSVHVQAIVIKTDDAVIASNTSVVTIANGATSDILSLATAFTSGSKVAVLATVSVHTSTSTVTRYQTSVGTPSLVRDTTVVVANQYRIRVAYPFGQSVSNIIVLPWFETLTAANPTYSIRIVNDSGTALAAFGQIVAFTVGDGAYLDGSSVSLSNGVQVTVGNLTTTLSGDVVVIGVGAYNYPSDTTSIFNAGDVVLQRNNSATGQISNAVALSGSDIPIVAHLPLFRRDTGVSNPSYQIKMTSRTTAAVNGEAKILAFLLVVGVDIKRVFGETLQLLENIILRRVRFRYMSENVSIGETSIRQRSRFRSLAETVSLGESYTSLKSIFRRVIEQVNLVENVVRVRNLARIILETINLSEVMVLLRQWVRVLTELVNLNEIFMSVRNRFRVSNETINLLESVGKFMLRSRILVESVNVIENIGKALGRTRVVNEFVNLLEAFGAFKDKVLRITENINLSESFSSIKGRLLVQVEQVRISEAFLRLRNMARVIVEQLNLSELFGVLRNRFRLVGEIINISESKFLSRVWVRIQDEVVRIGELGIKGLGKVKVIVENMRIVEARLLRLVKTYIKRLKSVLRGMSRSNLMGSSKGGEL